MERERPAWARKRSTPESETAGQPDERAARRQRKDKAQEEVVSKLGGKNAKVDLNKVLEILIKLSLQNATRRAFEQGRSKESILRALNARNRPTRGPFVKGDRVWWWSRTKRAALRSGGHVGGHKLGSWKGPATVLAQQGSIIWLSY